MSETEESRFQERTRTLAQELFAYRENTQLQQDLPQNMAPLQEQRDEEVRFFTEDEAVSLQSLIKEDMQVKNDALTGEELEKEQRSRALDFMYLMDMEVLIDKAPAMENRDEIEQDRAAFLRAGQEAHVLSAQARLERDRIIKHLRIDEVTRERLLKEDKDVRKILKDYTSKEEKDRIAKSGKEFLLTFRDMKTKLMKDPFLTAQEKALRLYRIAKPFSYEVTAYEKLYASELSENARQQGIEELLDRFGVLLNYFESDKEWTAEEKEDFYGLLGLKGSQEEESEHTKLFGTDEEPAILTKIRQKALRIDKKEEKEREPIPDDHLETAQISGVYAIDRFLIKNAGKDGGSPAFINKLLSLSVSERLLVYFLIQTDSLESPSAIDITFSQMGYVPDEGKVIGALTKKGFRKFFGARPPVLWEKLEAGLELIGNDAVAQTVRNMAAFESRKLSAAEAIDTAEEAGLEDLTRLENEVIKSEIDRDQRIKDYLNSLYECKKAIEERDSAFLHKSRKAAIAEEKGREAAAAFEALKKADLDLTNAINACNGLIPFHPEEEPDLEEAKETVTDSVALNYEKGFKRKDSKTGMFLSAQAASLASKIDKIPTVSRMFGGSPSIPAIDISLAMAGGALTLQGCLGAITGVVGMIGLIQHMKSGIGVTDFLTDVAKLGSTLTSTVWGPTNGLANMALFVPKVIKNAGKATETMGKVIDKSTSVLAKGALAVSTVKLAVDSVAMAQELKHQDHLEKAQERFDDLIEEGQLKGDDAAYAENILKLQSRNLAQKQANKAVDIVVDSGTFAVSMVALFGLPIAPLLALGWGVTAVGIAVGVKIADYFTEKEKKRDAVNDYLQLDNMKELGLPEGYEFLPQEKQEEYRQLIKEHMSAELGFTSTESLYRHMMKNYAQFLYNNLFYVEGDESMPIYAKGGSISNLEMGEVDDNGQITETTYSNYGQTELSAACYQVVKSLGLRVKYPKNSTYKPKPTVAQIAAKLAG